MGQSRQTGLAAVRLLGSLPKTANRLANGRWHSRIKGWVGGLVGMGHNGEGGPASTIRFRCRQDAYLPSGRIGRGSRICASGENARIGIHGNGTYAADPPAPFTIFFQ